MVVEEVARDVAAVAVGLLHDLVEDGLVRLAVPLSPDEGGQDILDDGERADGERQVAGQSDQRARRRRA